jgi:uncharacterized protein YndB with AHSA1/START domain
MKAMHAPLPSWPPSAADAPLRLLKIDTEVVIATDCGRVHAYATNAARWHEWHPATRSVDVVPDRPLRAGETIVEHISAAGRRFTATWTVIAVETPHLWVIVTDTPQGVARLAYRLVPLAMSDGRPATRFHRTLECRSKGWLLRLLDPLMLPLTLVPQSRRALANLKRVIEAGP